MIYPDLRNTIQYKLFKQTVAITYNISQTSYSYQKHCETIKRINSNLRKAVDCLSLLLKVNQNDFTSCFRLIRYNELCAYCILYR